MRSTSLTAHNIFKSYSTRAILHNVSFTLNSGDRLGLIGPNGCGKSTLLRLLAGKERPDKGTITLMPSEARVGYLAQGFTADPGLTVAHFIHQRLGDPELLETELQNLALALAKEPGRSDLQAAYDDTLNRLGSSRIRQVPALLASLNLAHVDREEPVGRLSGGQKTRLALAVALIQEPHLLLLDEPTNHLDIEMLEWLESWLNEYRGGVLIVSHDRTFLNHTITRVLELDSESHTLREFAGNYEAYFNQHLLEQEKQRSAYKNQEQELRRIRRDIHQTFEQARSLERATTPRNPYARKLAQKSASRAKARVKKLKRYLSDEARVEKPRRRWQMKVDFNDDEHRGRDVVRLEKLSVGYGGNPILVRGINQEIQFGRRVVMTGPNGAGKTTLLRTIAGQIPPASGRVKLGASVRMGHLGQEHALLNGENTALETIQSITDMNQTEARSFLHYYLFDGDDPLRPIARLSYGERARLALAVLVAEGCDFLLLDEPINHLDIPSRERFEQALSQFEGTVLAVVHDRAFIKRFASDLWLLKEGRLRAEILYDLGQANRFS